MTDSSVTGEQLVAAIHRVSGAHAGRRAVHALGVGARGVFRSSGDAARLTTAAHLQAGAETPVDIRFSNGSGIPDQADTVRDGRGFASKFRLADGSSTDLVALTLPAFFVRTPEDFLGLMAAREPDPETGEMDLVKILGFLGEHPEAQLAAEHSITAPFAPGYTDHAYNSIHAYWFVDGDGGRHKVRYRWEPVAPRPMLTDDDAAQLAADYLRGGLGPQLAEAPATFELVLIVGTDDDDETDPTVPWPDDRERIVAGRLEITELADQDETERMIFDPTNVTGGIECSDDQILHARSRAYGVSYELRTTQA